MITQHKQFEPIMPYPRCPNCGSLQSLDRYTYGWYKGDIVCVDCKCRYYVEFGGPDGDNLEKSPKLLETPDKIDPKLLAGLMVPAIPKELFAVYKEAAQCLAAGAPRGAAVLCRYVIQQALLLRGIPDQPPQTMVNIAHSKKLLSDTAHLQSSAAVFMGGKAGHPQHNWADKIGPDDAKQALLLTKRVVLELFYPAGLLG